MVTSPTTSSTSSITTSTTTTTTTTTTTSGILHVIEGSGQPEKIDIGEHDFGSGMEISDQAEDQSEEVMKVSLLNSEDLMAETEDKEEEEDNTENYDNSLLESVELNTDDADGGSGEFELIITLPDLSPEGSGSGGEFDITRKKKGLQTGEAVFQALVDFLLPDSKNSLVSNDKSFKDLFNIFAS